MHSISTQDNPIKKYLNLELDSESKFISVKQVDEVWRIQVKSTADCKSPTKTLAKQIEMFELLIRKLRSEPISGVAKKNNWEWKINQKVNVIFAEIFTKILANSEDPTSVRREMAKALEDHMKSHFIMRADDAEKGSSPQKGTEIVKRSASEENSGAGLMSSLFASSKKSKSSSSKRERAPSIKSKAHSAAPVADAGEHLQLELGPQANSIKTFTLKELMSCLFAWQATGKGKPEKEISFAAMQQAMSSDPISESDYEKIKGLEIYRNRSLASMAMRVMLNIMLKSDYAPDNMSQDYVRQFPMLDISGSGGICLWEYSEMRPDLQGLEQFKHLAGQFRLFLEMLMKKGCKNGESGIFRKGQLQVWDQIVHEAEKESESQGSLFGIALKNYWMFLSRQAASDGECESSKGPRDLKQLISLLSVCRQTLYVSPCQNLIFLFQNLNLKMRVEPYSMKYNFPEAGSVSVETCRTLELGNGKYDFIDSIKINIHASCSLYEMDDWISDIKLEVVPKAEASKERTRKLAELLSSYGLKVSIR